MGNAQVWQDGSNIAIKKQKARVETRAFPSPL